jgi:hypothetical protein
LPDTQVLWKKRNVQKILTVSVFRSNCLESCGNKRVILIKVVNNPFVRKGTVSNWLRNICFVLFI